MDVGDLGDDPTSCNVLDADFGFCASGYRKEYLGPTTSEEGDTEEGDTAEVYEWTCCVEDSSVTSDDVLRDRINNIWAAYGAQLTTLAADIVVPSGCCTPAALSPVDPWGWLSGFAKGAASCKCHARPLPTSPSGGITQTLCVFAGDYNLMFTEVAALTQAVSDFDWVDFLDATSTVIDDDYVSSDSSRADMQTVSGDIKVVVDKATQFFTAAAAGLASPASLTPAVCNEGALAVLTAMPFLPSVRPR
jgi:hypothetical protein